MDAQVAATVVAAIQKRVITSNDNLHFWNTGFIESFVGLLQLYTDKSSTSLKQSSVTSYPLHITFSNFSDDFRRQCISQDLTVVAYLPTSIEEVFSDAVLDPMPSMAHASLRDSRMALLHDAIASIIEPLNAAVLPGFHVTTGDGKRRVCHPVLASYCADIPEAKDLLSISHGVLTCRHCHRCLVKKEHLANPVCNAKARTMENTACLRSLHQLLLCEAEEHAAHRRPGQARDRRKQASELLLNFSLSETKSFLESLPFLR